MQVAHFSHFSFLTRLPTTYIDGKSSLLQRDKLLLFNADTSSKIATTQCSDTAAGGATAAVTVAMETAGRCSSTHAA